MGALESALESNTVVMADGAMGTMLMQAGLERGAPPEMWNTENAQGVRAIHRAYIEAGAQIVLTNTFGGSLIRLKRHDLQSRTAELNRAGAENARAEAQAAPHPVVVAGSMGPSGELLAPIGTLTPEEARESFAVQAAGLAEGGVDVVWVETMSDLEEVRAAVEGARMATALPVVVTMTFDTGGRTMMGTTPEQALEALRALGLLALGGNCGNGPAEIEGVIEAMRRADPSAVLVAKSNAGLPQLDGTEIIYDGTPEVMAAHALRARELGARIIGGCCGTTPDHIRAMAEALRAG